MDTINIGDSDEKADWIKHHKGGTTTAKELAIEEQLIAQYILEEQAAQAAKQKPAPPESLPNA